MSLVTSHDVARAAAVSQATVSRALRDDPNTSAATKKRVLEAALELGYVLNERGRSLSTRSTRRIGLVADLDNPLWPMLVGQIHDELSINNYSMTLLAERGDPVGLEASLLSGSTDGVIITSARLNAQLPRELVRRGQPVVLVNRTIDGFEVDAAIADNVAGGRAAAQLLLAAGHTRIGALFGPAETSTGRDREMGFRAALSDAGIALNETHVQHGAFAYSHGRDALPLVLRGRWQPTAVFCANDIIAIGAMNTARQLGLQVPGDLAITGFDDLEQASWPIFDLTTIKVPFDHMVRSAVSMLLERLAGQAGAPRTTVHPIEPLIRRTHLCGDQSAANSR